MLFIILVIPLIVYYNMMNILIGIIPTIYQLRKLVLSFPVTIQPSEVKIRENELASISYFNYGQFNGDGAISDILVTTYQKSGGTTINL